MANSILAPERGLPPVGESGTGLTPEQETCLDFVLQRIRTGQTDSMGVQGYAGCGKTFLVANHLIPQLRRMGLEVVVTAFTNRAVRVVRGYLNGVPGQGFVRTLTTSTLLGFRELPPEGKKPPRFEKIQPASLEGVDVVVVDEASMLPPEHFEAFEQERKSRSAVGKPLWVIYVGDPAQLPPVGIAAGKQSPAMELPGGRIAHLTTVMRTGGAVLDAATSVRQAKPGTAICFKPASSSGTSVVVHGNRQMARRTAKQLVDQLGSEFRILAWTNQAVDDWNRICRNHDLGADAPSFVVGERLITRAPIWDFEDISSPRESPICANGSELKILEATQTEVRFSPGMDAQPCWELVASSESLRHPITFYALDREDIPDYQKALEAWKAEAISSSGLHSKIIWRTLYYPALRLWGHLAGPCYATTVHRAQGGQWDSVLVDLGDVDRARRSNGSDHQKLLYTAVTRAQRELHLMEG